MIERTYLNGTILNLAQAVQAAQVYPEHHRRFHVHLDRLYGRISRLTSVLGTLHVGVIGDHFVIDEMPFLETNRLFPRKLHRKLQALGMEKISFREGITFGELKHFVQHLASGKESAEQRKWECISYGAIHTFEGAHGASESLALSLPRSNVLRAASRVLQTLMRSILEGNGRHTSGDGKNIVANVLSSLRNDDFLIHRLLRLKSHDDYTVTHSLNVCALVMSQALRIGIPENAVREIGLAALLHDIGKEAVQQEILRKPGRISAEEFARIADHPVHGANHLRRFECGTILPVIVSFEHHMKYDRTGYPKVHYQGALNVASYMTQIADVYDALRTNRPYRKELGHEEALAIMRRGRGTEFEPTLFDNFLMLITEAHARKAVPEG
jgi:putative nucleotidyltransferase with HDIG domain